MAALSVLPVVSQEFVIVDKSDERFEYVTILWRRHDWCGCTQDVLSASVTASRLAAAPWLVGWMMLDIKPPVSNAASSNCSEYVASIPAGHH